MFEKYLKDLGLSDKEAAIYLALLSTEKARIAEISLKAKVKRPTTYVILDALAKKGLVSESTVDKKTYYIAEPPEKLEYFINRQIQRLEENKKDLESIVPKLKSIQGGEGERPTVQFFDGKEGVLSSNADTFAERVGNEPVYIIYSKDLVAKAFSDKEGQQMRERRIALGIKSKAVYTSTMGERPSDATGERLKIDETKYPIESDISVYGDRVRIAVLSKNMSGIVIRNREFAATIKSLVNYIFDHK